MARRVWDDVIPEEVKQLYQKVGLGRRSGLGKRPALLLIDMVYNSVGDSPEPVMQSIEKYPHSCGELGWAAVPKIKELLSVAREKAVPVIYTTLEKEPFEKDLWKSKLSPTMVQSSVAGQKGTQFISELAPQEGDTIVVKKKSSAFFGTTLLSYLNQLQIDTLIVAGCATSSCVQATVGDASNYNYYVIAVEECIFDRHPFMHAIALFDIDAKRADVVSLAEAKDYLRSLPVQGDS
ncbi:MAG: isochorismatase family protein [Candidatus Binatia bacterium]